MLYYVAVAYVLLYVGFVSLIEGLCCAVSPSLCLKLNLWITTDFVRRIMAIFNAHLGLTLLADSSEKERLPARCLVIANHQSFMDIPVLLAHLDGPRLKFVAKAELGHFVPMVSAMLKMDGHCLVERGTHSLSDMEAIDSFAQNAMEHNWIPVIFPEGKCSRDGSVGAFHAAGFRRLLDSSPLPVAVFAIDGGWKYPNVARLIRELRHEKGNYRVKLLAVFPAPNGRKEQKRVLSDARELIRAQLEAWRSC